MQDEQKSMFEDAIANDPCMTCQNDNCQSCPFYRDYIGKYEEWEIAQYIEQCL